MTMTLDRPTVEFINAEAERLVTENPPSKIALTVFLSIFTAVGWCVGRTWFHLAKIVPLIVLACRYGYRQGAKVPVEMRKPVPAQ